MWMDVIATALGLNCGVNKTGVQLEVILGPEEN